MGDTRRNLHQFPKGKQLYSALYGVYTGVLHDLTAILKWSAAKGETAKTTITTPPSMEEFREQRRRKRKPTYDADKRAKKPTTSTTGINDPQLRSKPEFPTRKYFVPLKSIQMNLGHGDNADDTTERGQHQAPSSQAGGPPSIVLTSQGNLIQLRKLLKGLLKTNYQFHNIRNWIKAFTKEIADL
jgi:hypothetical protein